VEFNRSIDHDSRMWDDVGCDAGCWMTDRHMCKYETRTHVCTAVRVCVSTYEFGMCMLYSIVNALRKITSKESAGMLLHKLISMHLSD
jgi:hypothetical protein